MATKIGTFVLIKVGGKILVGQNSLSYNKTATMIEISSKTSGNRSEFVSGRLNEIISVSGIAGTTKESTLAGYSELYDTIEAGAAVTVLFTEFTDKTGTTPVVGSETVSVSALISNLTWESPDNATNTFSCDLQITGDPTKSTNVAPL